jgi:hypothetical protein
MTPSRALGLWKTSKGHNDVIQNKGIWRNSNWKAMGASVDGGYDVLWFGKKVDPGC